MRSLSHGQRNGPARGTISRAGPTFPGEETGHNTCPSSDYTGATRYRLVSGKWKGPASTSRAYPPIHLSSQTKGRITR